MPPRCGQLYCKNNMCSFCIYTENVVALFSAAQTLRGVFNVATRGIELASLARTLTTLGRLKTSTITRVDFVNRSWTFLRDPFRQLRRRGRRSGLHPKCVPRLAVSFVSPYCEDHRRSYRVRLHSGGCRTGISFGDNQLSFFGAKWFFRIVVSCTYVFSEGEIGEQRS